MRIGAKESSMSVNYRYNHLGIPTKEKMPGMIHVRHLKISCTDHQSNPFGIQWMKYDEDCTLPQLVQNVTHIAFEVDNLQEAINGKNVIVQPNSPSPGLMVAMIEEAGAPVELMEYLKEK
jgi:hypothetical protein